MLMEALPSMICNSQFLSLFFFFAPLQGSSPPLISDVALAVASKLTTAVLSKLSAARLVE